CLFFFFFFSSRRRHTRWPRDWSSDVCSSDLSDSKIALSGSPTPGLRAILLSESQQLYCRGSRGKQMRSSASASERRRQQRGLIRSEERRVGKECRYGWRGDH